MYRSGVRARGSPDPDLVDTLPMCGEGREGRACSVCKEGYYKSGGKCIDCGSDAQSVVPFVFTIIILFLLGLLFHVFVNAPQSRKIAVTLNISLTLGMLINFMQNLTIVGTFNIKFPSYMKGLFKVSSIFLFDIHFVRIGCVVGRTPLASYVTRQLVPIVLAIIFYSLWGLFWCLKQMRLFPGADYEIPRERSRRSSLTRVMFRVAHGKDVSRRIHRAPDSDAKPQHKVSSTTEDANNNNNNNNDDDELPDEAFPTGGELAEEPADQQEARRRVSNMDVLSPSMRERTHHMLKDVAEEEKEKEDKIMITAAFAGSRNPFVRWVETLVAADIFNFDKYCNSLGMAIQILYISFVNNACAAFQVHTQRVGWMDGCVCAVF